MSKNRLVRISAGQLPAELSGRSLSRKRSQNLIEIGEMIRTASHDRSDFILFGEYANLYHRSLSQKPEDYRADAIPGPFVNAVATLARKNNINIALPVFGRWENELSSYVVFFDRRGKIVDCYKKTHPTMAEQGLGIRQGSDMKIINLDFGRVGTMTCMDIEYPEVAQVLMLRGAELLLFPHVQSGWGEANWEIRYRSRAIDTGLPVLSACYGYPPGEWRPGKMIGRSGVIGRDGGILSDLGRGIGVVTAELDLSVKRVTEFFFTTPLDRTLAVQASRRPELYAELVDNGLRDRALRRVQSAAKKRRKK